MTNPLQITVPQDVANRAQQVAEALSKPVEEVLIEYLNTFSELMPQLPDDIQSELQALHYLSDDALWTIAREQMPSEIQEAAHQLMTRNIAENITSEERKRLETYVERSDRLLLRKAEAAAILQKRGYTFTQADFRPKHE